MKIALGNVQKCWHKPELPYFPPVVMSFSIVWMSCPISTIHDTPVDLGQGTPVRVGLN